MIMRLYSTVMMQNILLAAYEELTEEMLNALRERELLLEMAGIMLDERKLTISE